MPDYCPNGRGQGQVTHFYILGPDHIFVGDEARHFNFGLQVEKKITGVTHVKVLQYGAAFRVT